LFNFFRFLLELIFSRLYSETLNRNMTNTMAMTTMEQTLSLLRKKVIFLILFQPTSSINCLSLYFSVNNFSSKIETFHFLRQIAAN